MRQRMQMASRSCKRQGNRFSSWAWKRSQPANPFWTSDLQNKRLKNVCTFSRHSLWPLIITATEKQILLASTENPFYPTNPAILTLRTSTFIPVCVPRKFSFIHLSHMGSHVPSTMTGTGDTVESNSRHTPYFHEVHRETKALTKLSLTLLISQHFKLL